MGSAKKIISWAFYIGETLLTRQEDCKDDIVYVYFSFFQGPNAVIWKSKNPYMNFQLNKRDTFKYIFTYGNNFRIDLCLKSYGYDSLEGCYQAIFVPRLLYYLEFDLAENPISTKNVKTVGDILQLMIGGFPEIQFKADKELKNLKMFPEEGISLHRSFLEFLTNLAFKLKKELLITNNSISIGEYIGDKTLSKPFSIFYSADNRISNITVNNKQFLEVVGVNVMPIKPPQIFQFQGKNYRAVFTRYIFHQNYIESLVVCTTDFSIRPKELFQAIPRDTISLLFEGAININMLTAKGAKLYRSIWNGKIKKDLPNVTETDMDDKNWGIQQKKLNIRPAEGSVTFIKSSPYAGEFVGLQFPQNIGGVNFGIQSELDSPEMVAIGQVFQKDSNGKLLMPYKESSNDFRLTLPDGGTMFYSDFSGTFFLLGKKKVFIITKDKDDLSKQIPNITNSSAYISVENDAEIPKISIITVHSKDIIYVEAPVVSLGKDLNSEPTLPLSVKPHRHVFKHVHMTVNGPTVDPNIIPQPMTTDESNMNTSATEAN